MIVQKGPIKFLCEDCDFTTSRKSQYARHILTNKHQMIVNDSEKVPKNCWECNCGKI